VHFVSNVKETFEGRLQAVFGIFGRKNFWNGYFKLLVSVIQAKRLSLIITKMRNELFIHHQEVNFFG